MASRGVTALYGPSGCGKTSLLRAISGLDRHANAMIHFNGEIWQDNAEFLAVHRRDLAYVFQEPSLFAHLSVKQNLEFAADRARRTDRHFDANEISRRLNITHLLQRDCHSLSGGERQRVAIARALCAQPRLLLMDEPLSALDADHKAEIIPLLEGVCRGSAVPIIYVSHSLDEVARFADDLLLMEQGQVVHHGAIADVLSRLDSPLAQQVDAAAIVEGCVLRHEPDFGLTHITTSVGELSIAHAQNLKPGDELRVRLHARDVSIALEQPENTSILNSLVAKIVDMREQDAAQVMIRLEANGTPLLAKITRKSLSLLQLEIGQQVVLQVKSVALL